MADGNRRFCRKPSIAIIGAGLSGLCMAIKLKNAGFEKLVVFEKASRVGGTWRDNTYPGVACDVPSHLYSYSFAPKPDWSMVFSPGGEIQEYIEGLTRDLRLGDHIEFGKELTSARWKDRQWHLSFKDGTSHVSDFLVNAMGGLHVPSYPDIPGKETFRGTSFHTASWDHSHDLSGKRVAVIGTAASAIQLIPEIVNKVAHLDVYQRTPNWIVPRPFMTYSDKWKKRFSRFPWLEKLHRLQIFLMFEMRFPLFRQNRFLANRASKMFSKHLETQIHDPELRRKLTPDYPIGCKRILASDTYFPALQQKHVTLVTEAIEAVTAKGITTLDGIERPVDTIIYATGFKPWDQMEGITITGKGGLDMNDHLTGGIRAHRTVAMPHFPNLFLLLGPNSGLGHNSVILMIEAQVRYIMDALQKTTARNAKVIEAKQQAAEEFDSTLQQDLEGTVWAGHCKSWYQGDDGRIYTLWPWSTVRYRREMKKIDEDEYEFES